jgi:hypothetical protein
MSLLRLGAVGAIVPDSNDLEQIRASSSTMHLAKPRWTPKPVIDRHRKTGDSLTAAETLTKAEGLWFLAGMSNVLDDERQQQILALGRLGWTLRRIQALDLCTSGSIVERDFGPRLRPRRSRRQQTTAST